MKSKLEKQLDTEFEKMEIRPRVYHFTKDVVPFVSVTIASVNIRTKNGAKNLIRKAISISTRHSFFQPATHVLEYLNEPCGEYGIAICNYRDQFNRQRGRIISKGRLLKHLKEVKR